ncbi:MAG: hypothetical protein KM312_13630 [Hydrogenibacillus schlegelii]|uniref:Uncharacterized protein n=1 Tax=Hydrogenibacillus schlegelii TaxID=1484 RepID=A0A947D6K2_HYDSH|nr:hypothetical protein [Hydrogenibacillus schlegelii]
MKPLEIRSISVATKRQMAGGFLTFIIPFLLVVSSVSGGMAAVDLVAGEKEAITSTGCIQACGTKRPKKRLKKP